MRLLRTNISNFATLTQLGAIAGGIKGATDPLPTAINEQGIPVGSSLPSRIGNIAVNAAVGAGLGHVGTGLLKNTKAGKYDHIINPLREKAQPYIDKLPSVDIEIARKTQPSKEIVNDLSGVNIPKF